MAKVQPVEDTQDHVEEVVQQDVDNVNRVAEGKNPGVVPTVPEHVEDHVDERVGNDVKTVQGATKVETKTGVPEGKKKSKKAKDTKKAAVKKEEDDELPGLKTFLPACLVHTGEMVNQIDRSYTDL